MRFSIQESGQNKKFFHRLSAAQKETGLHVSIIKMVLERNNSSHHRKSDNKLFFIQKEPPQKILTVEGEDFFSLEEIQEKFGLSPTKFLNQVKNQKFPHEIAWISPEIFSPESASSSSEKVCEIESLREEMKKLSDRIQKLEKELKEIKESSPEKIKESSPEKIKESSPEKIKESSPEKIKESSPEKIKESSPEKILFDTSEKFENDTFNSFKDFAAFLRSGIEKMIVHGPKKNQNVIWDGKIVFLPDLVKEIISTHINKQMWEDGDEEAQCEFLERFTFQKNAGDKCVFIKKIRRLNETAIHEISKELIKYF